MRRDCIEIRTYIIASLTLAALTFFMPGTARSEDGKAALSLEQCIGRAVEVNAEVKGAEFEAEVYRDKKEQADAARYPQGEVIAYGSLSPRARLKNGSTIESTTNINKESYDGVFGRATVQLIQPLYTFGKIKGYRDAASHGVAVYEAGAKLKATEVAMQVKEAYFGLLLAQETKGLIDEIKESINKATDKVQRQLDAGAPGVDQVDLFKLQTYQGEIDKYDAEAVEGMEKARFGLMLLTDYKGKEEGFEIADQFLIPDDLKVEDYVAYRDRAMGGRLEFQQLKEGLLARESLIAVELAEYYPQVFLAVFGSVAGATNRDHLNNPYVFDDYNHSVVGAVLGFKWSFDFGIHRGRLDEARAEYLKLKMKDLYAEGGVPFQVKDAHLQLKKSIEQMAALSRAYKTAKQWAVASLSNFDMGVGEARDIADSISAYARIRADYFRAVYNQKMAIANLDHATGRDAVDIPYTVRTYPTRDIHIFDKVEKAGGI